MGVVQEVALPLKGVETDCAPDSTGFSTSVYDRWFDHKWGKEKEEGSPLDQGSYNAGVKTNIVTAVEVTETAANDSPFLAPFVETTARGFDEGKCRRTRLT